jgi:hypothetical protein
MCLVNTLIHRELKFNFSPLWLILGRMLSCQLLSMCHFSTFQCIKINFIACTPIRIDILLPSNLFASNKGGRKLSHTLMSIH